MNANSKAAISLTTGLEDPERVTVAFLVALGAAEAGWPTVIFLTKEAVRLAVPGVGRATACEACPPLADLMDRYERAGGRYLVCSVCVQAKNLDAEAFITGAEVGGSIQLWQWIGDGATTFSY